jgi:hypothetical protein
MPANNNCRRWRRWPTANASSFTSLARFSLSLKLCVIGYTQCK